MEDNFPLNCVTSNILFFLKLRRAVWAASCFDGDGAEAMGALFGGGLCRCGCRFCCQAVHSFDHQEDHKGNDQEIDDILDKGSIRQN